MNPNTAFPILALDVRSNRIGYASFDHRTELLEAGVTRFKGSEAAATRFAYLLRTVGPRVVVVREIAHKSSRNCRGTKVVLLAVRRLAQLASVDLVHVTDRNLRRKFLKEGLSTKYAIASFLVRSYPALAWRLPPPRKPWLPEHRNMAIFDAAALGMTYFASAKCDYGMSRYAPMSTQTECFRRSLGDE